MSSLCNIITADDWGRLPELLAGEKEIFVVHDQNVSAVAKEISSLLPIKGCLALSTSEQDKTMEQVLAIERGLLKADATRGALILAIGGGITTDMAGFAAAIYKRGIRYASIPTTLLAQVDAAIGGKTGVNLDGFKNMLGAFHMPLFTYICPLALNTLPPRELRCGLAEMLKTFLLSDANAYTQAIQLLTGSPAGQVSGLPELITRAASIKAEMVTEDPTEKGVRAKLNLGHTFGHAIEQQALINGDSITHGEAVAMGMVMAARVAEAAGIAQKGLEYRLIQDFEAVGLPTRCPYPAESLKEAMKKDKKATGSAVKFVLPVTPGQVVLQEMTVEKAYDLYLHSK